MFHYSGRIVPKGVNCGGSSYGHINTTIRHRVLPAGMGDEVDGRPIGSGSGEHACISALMASLWTCQDLSATLYSPGPSGPSGELYSAAPLVFLSVLAPGVKCW